MLTFAPVSETLALVRAALSLSLPRAHYKDHQVSLKGFDEAEKATVIKTLTLEYITFF